MDVANRTKDEAFALWNKRVAVPVPAMDEWQPVNPVSMANDEYADAEIMLCYRRPATAAGEEEQHCE